MYISGFIRNLRNQIVKNWKRSNSESFKMQIKWKVVQTGTNKMCIIYFFIKLQLFMLRTQKKKKEREEEILFYRNKNKSYSNIKCRSYRFSNLEQHPAAHGVDNRYVQLLIRNYYFGMQLIIFGELMFLVEEMARVINTFCNLIFDRQPIRYHEKIFDINDIL